MIEKAGTGNISISIANVTEMSEHGMNEAQLEAVGGGTAIRLEAVDDKGNSAAEFGKGFATVAIKYKRKGDNSNIVNAFKVNNDGSLTDMKAKYDNGEVSWSTGSFSFYLISEIKGIEPVAIEETKPSASLPFSDVSESDWFYEAVEYVYNNGLFSGVTNTEFGPNTAMTRAMLVTVIYRMEGAPNVSESAGFGDVASGAYYSDPIAWAAKNQIVGGYSNGIFGVNDPVTREQMVAILYRYAMYKQMDVSARTSLDGFADAADISGYAVEPMEWAVSASLVSGTGNGMISPASNATRAQVASILQRYSGLNN